MSSAGTLRPEPKAQGEPAKLHETLWLAATAGLLEPELKLARSVHPLESKSKCPRGERRPRTRLRETARPAAAANHKVSREFRRESQGADDQF